MLWVGSVGEGALDHPDDGAELAVIDADDDDAAGVGSAFFCPSPDDPGEVGDVEGDEDPLFGRSQGEEFLVGHAVEFPLFVGSSDVVACLPERPGDATT